MSGNVTRNDRRDRDAIVAWREPPEESMSVKSDKWITKMAKEHGMI